MALVRSQIGVVSHQVLEVKAEIDCGPQHGFQDQEGEAPNIIGDSVHT